MKIDKSCGTCEFNFGGSCADEGDYGYGGAITDLNMQRDCWSISFDYSVDLAESLPEEDNLIYHHDDEATVSKLIERIETGSWNFSKRRSKTRVQRSNGEWFEW